MSAGKLPEGWETSSIGDLCKKVTDGSHNPPKASETGLPMLSAKNINNGSIIFNETHRVISEAEFWEENKRTNIESGDVLLTIVGTLGRTALVPQDFIPFTLQRSVAVMSTSELEPSYFRYALENREFQIQIHENAKGTAQKGIYLNALKKLTINIAPKNEQKIITEKLDTLLAQVDSTKARLEQIPQILKRFRQAVLAAAMRGELSETWRTHNSFNISLHKYYELTKGKKLKAKNIAEPCEENTWLRCNIGHIFNVKSGDGLTAKEMNSSGDIPVYGGNGITGYHDKYNTEESTIVIGRVGYYCGSVHLTPEKSWITDNALLVDFNRDLITEKFAYWLLKATNLRVDTSSSAQPVISGAKIYSIEIVVPPVEEQREIVRRVEQLFAYADTIEKQVNNALARVNNLTQSILAKAFRGELTAQWRAENPDLISGENSAAALLEKIKAERAASGGKKASRKKS
ncbi:restriction endonuclease subunit S [Escherichia coli]|uniref:restriction endonuclease subunit S n=1 Tax=Escherichia coli TaxID=562 RepID=UPI0028937C4C|nr:restriction endonuclease subunit S [Escherichia coli]WNK03346.1 restriction endonuclease subunit S [Escherichia coli]